MDPLWCLAVELPPVPAAGPASLDPWWEAVFAAARAGAGMVWFTGVADAGGPAAGDPAVLDPAVLDPAVLDPAVLDPADGDLEAGDFLAVPRWCDSCTIAAAAVSRIDGVLLGVVSELPRDRHPSVLAREVTTLDVLSAGRAAVVLRWAGAGRPARVPEGLSTACEHLGEAVAICRAVLQDDDPVFEGHHLHIAGAVNRPPPLQEGGPLIFVHAPSGATELVRRGAGASSLLRQAVAAAAAIVCPDDPQEIASWRGLVEDAAAGLWTRGAPREVPRIVCRTTLPFQTRLTAARAAGADGVVVRLPGIRPGGALSGAGAGAGGAAGAAAGQPVEQLAEQLAGCFEPWQRPQH